jgi:hypothetical protein
VAFEERLREVSPRCNESGRAIAAEVSVSGLRSATASNAVRESWKKKSCALSAEKLQIRRLWALQIRRLRNYRPRSQPRPCPHHPRQLMLEYEHEPQ